jgi:hypothetical protein
MKYFFYIFFIVLVLLAGPVWVLVSGQVNLSTDWRTAKRTRVYLAPEPSQFKPALVQVYAARAYNWRGMFAEHLWIATKAKDAKQYTNYEVLGWNKYRGKSVVTINHLMPDRRWYDHKPRILAEIIGRKAQSAIRHIKQAVASYPYKNEYVLWPGPNSNTFVAYVLRRTPELRVDLPTTAIGKDYLADDRFFAVSPTGSGGQFSVFGLLGVTTGIADGLEFNLLGLNFGIDVFPPAIKWPGVDRIGFKEKK